jgi:hypothetical protein
MKKKKKREEVLLEEGRQEGMASVIIIAFLSGSLSLSVSLSFPVEQRTPLLRRGAGVTSAPPGRDGSSQCSCSRSLPLLSAVSPHHRAAIIIIDFTTAQLRFFSFFFLLFPLHLSTTTTTTTTAAATATAVTASSEQRAHSNTNHNYNLATTTTFVFFFPLSHPPLASKQHHQPLLLHPLTNNAAWHALASEFRCGPEVLRVFGGGLDAGGWSGRGALLFYLLPQAPRFCMCFASRALSLCRDWR